MDSHRQQGTYQQNRLVNGTAPHPVPENKHYGQGHCATVINAKMTT
jgi:hypothetical protein